MKSGTDKLLKQLEFNYLIEMIKIKSKNKTKTKIKNNKINTLIKKSTEIISIIQRMIKLNLIQMKRLSNVSCSIKLHGCAMITQNF